MHIAHLPSALHIRILLLLLSFLFIHFILWLEYVSCLMFSDTQSHVCLLQKLFIIWVELDTFDTISHYLLISYNTS